MSQDEHLPEELTDTERLLVTLAPRGSRIDRDRLMIALGEQSAARGATPWKWATGASLLLALVLGVRPALETQEDGAQQIAEQENGSDAIEVISSAATDSKDAIPDHRAAGEEFDWLRALASGRFDSTRPLTVRPELTTGDFGNWNVEVAVRDETEKRRPAERTPMLRWGDERLRRGEAEMFVPRT